HPACNIQPCGAVLLLQVLQAQTRAVASLWVGLLAQDRGYQGGRLRTDLARPGDQRRGTPLSMCAVRRRHVLSVGRVLPLGDARLTASRYSRSKPCASLNNASA